MGDHPAFMIDGARTVDRDDAIRLTTAADGARVLEVYIADLTAAVAADPGLTGVALERVATQYRAQVAVETMLPREIEAAHSLAEGKARDALLIRLPLAENGEAGPATISQCVLEDAVALTHEQAASAVKDRRSSHHQAMTELRDVAEILFRARYGSTSAFYDFARGVFVNEDGKLVRVRASHVVGHLIVQECMIAANRAVAEWALPREMPIIFRNHAAALCEPPADVHLGDLSAALRNDDPSELALWLARSERTGRRARYDAYPRGHHGLGIPVYCHATSPLRRAADLVTQQAIVAALGHGVAPFTVEQVAGYCERLTVGTAEMKAAGSEATRARAHETARRILEQDTDYKGMSTERFFALVKRSTKEGICSPGFLAEVARRAQRGRLELRDLYHVLFLPVGEQWAGAKAACVAQAARAPEMAVSLLAMHAVTVGLAQPEYVVSETGPQNRRVFEAWCQATVPPGAALAGAARRAKSKKAARGLAALSVLALIAGVPDPTADVAPAAAPGPEESAPSAAAPAAVGDPLAELNHARNLQHFTDLRVDYGETRGTDGRPVFTVVMNARRGAGEVAGRGSADSKKQAKSMAARDLLDRLSEATRHAAAA